VSLSRPRAGQPRLPDLADVRTTRRVGSWVTDVHLNGPPERERPLWPRDTSIRTTGFSISTLRWWCRCSSWGHRLCSRCWPRCGAQAPDRTDVAGSGTTG